MKKSALLCLFIITAMVLVGCTAAVNTGNNVVDTQNGMLGFISADLESKDIFSQDTDLGINFIKDSDMVTVIVNLGDGIVESYLDGNDDLTVAEYIMSAEGQALIAEMHSEQEPYLLKLFESGMDFEMHSIYTTLLNGFALEIRYGDIEIVERICGKDNVSISEVYSMPTTSVDYEALFAEEGLFANSTGHNGEGMVVAVVDTAIDDRHEAFQTMPVNPVMTRENVEEILGALLINDDFWVTVNPKTGELEYMPRPYTFTANDVYASAKVPFAFDYANGFSDILERGQVNFARPQDYDQSQYHGTHVSGIAVGNNGDSFKSAASEAQLVAMKVFEDGSAGATVATIINALSDALILGVDGINLSLGIAAGPIVDRAQTGYGDFMEIASRCGITVCCATGNDNVSSYDYNYRMTQLTSNPDNGIVASPASFEGNLGIGSIDNNTYYYAYAGEKRINLNAAVTDLTLSTDPLAFLDGAMAGEFEFVVVPGVGEAADYEGLNLEGKIALVKRGTISFTEKAQHAEKHGAIAILVYNNEDGIINPQLEAKCIPVMSISRDDGAYLIANPEMKISFSRENRGYAVSIFSSKGALEDLSLGVDLLGVGGNVLSAADTQIANGATNGYTVLSGTSMASPNTVSAMMVIKGMLKEQFPNLSSRRISILAQKIAMSTADIVRDANGMVYSPRSQGAGLININAATTTEAYLEVTGSNYTKLNLGSDIKKDGVYTLSFYVVNMGENLLTYDVSAIALTELAEGRYMTGNSKELGMDYTVSLNGKAVNGTEIQVPAGERAKIKIVITIDDEAKAYMDETYENGIYVDGFGVLESLDGGADLSIPFIAFYGDWYQAPVFEPSMVEDREIQDLPVFIHRSDAVVPGTFFINYQTRVQYDPVNPDNISFKYNSAIANLIIPMLRNASMLTVELFDQVTGDIFAYGNFSNLQKAYWYYGQQYVCVQLNLGDASFIFNNESWLNNGTLAVRFVAQFNGQGHYETIIPFRLDFEAPTLQSVTRVEEGDKTYLDLEVYDNQSVSYIGVFTEDEKTGEPVQIGKVEKPVSYNDLYQEIKSFNQGELNAIRFDLTEYLPYVVNDKVYLTICDYARNEVGYELIYDNEKSNANNVVENRKNTSFAYNFGEGMESVSALEYNIYNTNVNEMAAKRVQLLAESSGSDFVIRDGVLEAYAGQGGDVVIPDGVKKIAEYVFYQNDKITSIVLPEGLEQIDSFNFYEMPNLESIKLPTTLTTLGTNIFVMIMKCKDINIEDTQVTYYAGSFVGVGLDGDVVLPDPNGKTIEIMESFMGIPYIDSVVVKAHVKNLYLSFLFGYEMKTLVFEKSITQFDYQSVGSILECHALETITFKGNVTAFGKQLSTYSTQNVSHTGFALKSLRAIYFEGNVGSIYGMGFTQCPNLETVSFGGTLSSFNTMTFSQCKKLTRFTVAEGNTSMIMDDESGVMYNSSKTRMFMAPNWDAEEFVVPETVTSLQDSQFCPGFGGVESYNATWIENEDGTIQMGIEFLNASSLTVNDVGGINTTLKKVTLHSGIKTLPAQCFAMCRALEEVNTENVTTFRNYSFYDSGLKEFVASETNKSFGSRVFKDCKNMTKLEFHDNCTFPTSQYDSNWFYSGLTSIKEIVVPKNFNFTGAVEAFSLSTSLERVINKSTKGTTFGQFAFYGCSSLVELVGFEKVTRIAGTGAFAYCTSLKEINLPGLTDVYYSAFEGCTSLERYTFSDNLTNIRTAAFYNCVSLKEIKLGAKTNVNEFDRTFYNCSSVETITIHEKNPYFVLVDDVIYNKAKTTLYLSATTNPTEKFVIPETVTTIIAGAFKNSQNIQVLDLNRVKNIPDEMFMDSNIREVIGAPVTVGASAFKNTQLDTIDLSKMTSVGSYAFENTKLVEVDLSNLNQGVGFGAFKNNETLEKIVIGANTGYFYLPFTFANCPNVTEIVLDANNRSFVIEDDTLYNADKTAVLKYFGNEEVVTVREGVKKIFIGAYQGNEAIKEVVLPSTLKMVGDAAFYGCTNLKKITFKSEKAPILESSYSETRLLTYNNFVDYVDSIDNTTIAIYTPNDASYATYIWRMYFANRYLLP